MDKDNETSLLNLFLTFLRINAITFGGGYTIVAILRDEFSVKKNLIDNDEMLNITALSQSSPGPFAINTSILVGYKLKGIIGSLVCLLASVIPSLIIITVVSMFYQAFRDNFYVNAALRGMAGVISAVLIITSINMAKSAMKNHKIFSLVIMIIAFLASFVFKVSTVYIILFFGILSFITFSLISEEDLK